MRLFSTLLLTIMLLPIPAAAQEMPPARVIITRVVQQETAPTQSILGTLYYERVSHVSSELAGLVAEAPVAAGERVGKGTPLITLDTEILDIDITLTETRIAQIALRIEHAEKNFQRLERLFAQEGISAKDYEDALYAHQDLLKEKKISEENLAKFLTNKRRSVITAPFDGIILSKNVDVGDWVQQGKEIVAIGSTSDLYVLTPVGETMLRHITIGDRVPVTINAYGRELTGTISAIAPKADPQTKNVFLKVKIPPQDDIAEHMSATLSVPAGPRQKLAIIPRDALVEMQGASFIYTIKEGKATLIPVKIAAFLGRQVGIDNAGIAEGMAVVVEGNERLRPDQAVEVSGEE